MDLCEFGISVRSVLQSDKKAMSFDIFSKKYKEVTDEKLPKEYRSVTDIIKKLPGLVRLSTYNNSEIELIPTSETLHLNKLICGQKYSKPKTKPVKAARPVQGQDMFTKNPYKATYAKRLVGPSFIYTKKNEKQVPVQKSQSYDAMKNRRKNSEVFGNNEVQLEWERAIKSKSKRKSTVKHPSQKEASNLLSLGKPEGFKNAEAKKSIGLAMSRSASQLSNSSDSSGQDSSGKSSSNSHVSDYYRIQLRELLRKRDMPNAQFDLRVLKLKTSSHPLYMSRVTLGSVSFHSYPEPVRSPEEAEEAAAKKAFLHFSSLVSIVPQKPEMDASIDKNKFVDNLLKIVQAEKFPMRDSAVAPAYFAMYKESIPDNWIEILKEFPRKLQIECMNATNLGINLIRLPTKSFLKALDEKEAMEEALAAEKAAAAKEQAILLAEMARIEALAAAEAKRIEDEKLEAKRLEKIQEEAIRSTFATTEEEPPSFEIEQPLNRSMESLYINSPDISEGQRLPPALVLTSTPLWNVVMTEARSTKEIIFQLVEHSQFFFDFTERLHNYFTSRPNLKISNVQVNRVYAAIMDEETLRCEALSEEIDGQVQLRCVDNGAEFLHPITQLRDIPNDFMCFPFQAFKAELYGLNEYEDDISFIVPLQEMIKKEGGAVSLVATPVVRSDPISVILWDTSSKFDVNLNEMLVKKHKEASESEKNNNHLQPTGATSLPSFPVPVIQPNPTCDEDYFHAIVGQPASPSNFLLISESSFKEGSDYMKMMSNMQQLYEEEEKIELHSSMVQKDGLFAVKDGRWKRCQVENIILEDSTYLIRLVDEGGLLPVNLEQLQPLYSQFAELPIQCVRANIHGIKPLGKDWDAMTVYRFLLLTRGKIFRCIIHDQTLDEDEPCLQVTLISKNDETNIAEKLISEKLALKHS